MRHHFLLLSFMLAPPLLAQTTGAVVNGTVFCEDTGKPAHFARVFFVSAEPDHSGETFMRSMQEALQKSAAKTGKLYTPPTDEQRKQQADAARKMDSLTSMLNATNAGLDGSYRATGLRPGTYYIHAQLPGYIDPFTEFTPEDFTSTDPAVRARVAALPTVRIDGDNDRPTLNLRLQHGASLSGRVLYDDGTPAAGWNVWAVRKGAHVDDDLALSPAVQREAASEMGQPATGTDDRGIYRISGLPPGEYTMRASAGALATGTLARTASMSGSGIRITVYSGNKLHAAQAQTISVRGGEEETVPDITVPIHSLHTLAGRVTAASDGHALTKGTVVLSAKDDPDVHGKAAVMRDGTFRFEDLTGNTTYTLTLSDAADATYTDGKPGLLGMVIPKVAVQQTYVAATQDAVLPDADNTGVVLAMTAADPSLTPSPQSRDERAR